MNQNDLKTLALAFEKSLKRRNLSQGTIKGAAWRLSRFLDYLKTQGITHIDGITKEVVTAYQAELYQSINKKEHPNE